MQNALYRKAILLQYQEFSERCENLQKRQSSKLATVQDSSLVYQQQEQHKHRHQKTTHYWNTQKQTHKQTNNTKTTTTTHTTHTKTN